MIGILTIGLGFIFLAVSLVLFFFSYQQKSLAAHLASEAKSRLKNAKRDAESERKEALVRTKDEIYKRRKEFELEKKRERFELDHLQNRLSTKAELIDARERDLDTFKRELSQKERELTRSEDIIRANETKLKTLYNNLIAKLELVGKMTQEEARKTLLETLNAEVRLSNQKYLQKVEEKARVNAKQRSIDIIVNAMQRYTADNVAEHTSSVVQLPAEDMKGRIIGKEGRNIKALEMATGMEFIIGEGSDYITISGFNPVRRETARRALERLVSDGRINPTRIEETVEKCEAEIDEIIEEYGKETILEMNLQGVHPELITLLGKLHFRTSYSQNVLQHSKEVAYVARMIAEELGLDGEPALRGGLLHDIGKAVSAEVEGPHAEVGANIAKRCGENEVIVNAIAAHHEEVPFTSIYSPIVVIADAISASRPGARRETLTTYLKRLEQLEEIANSFEGIKRAFALQAGREIRVIVVEDQVSDEEAATIAREIARKVEQEMNFPGQIKIHVIREKRSIEYAR